MLSIGIILIILGIAMDVLSIRIIMIILGIAMIVFARVAHRRNTKSYSAYNTFESEDTETFSIDQDEFERIVFKHAYRIKRIDNVRVQDNWVCISIKSQSSLSIWEAQIQFKTYGTKKEIGSYYIFSDNEDSNIPEFIAQRVQEAIRTEVGIT